MRQPVSSARDEKYILTNKERMKGIQGQDTGHRYRGGSVPVVLMDGRVAGFGAQEGARWKEETNKVHAGTAEHSG